MTKAELHYLLDELISNWESEVVEFKQASTDSFSTADIGKYFSALANEANLCDQDVAWLVFGVHDKSRKVIGSSYREEPERLQSVKHQIQSDSDPPSTFRNIYELDHPDGRVILFEIPAAPLGIPIAWKGHYYARAGESLTSLPLSKLDEIRSQRIDSDWTAQVVENGSIDHLDDRAIEKAKENFILKSANRFTREEIENWSIETFLDRTKLTVDGKLTRTAVLLLGKEESSHLLTPHPAQLIWKLLGPESANQIFGPPFLLATTELYQKIRNFQIRILPESDLVLKEVAKYDQKVVLEAIHNCIAHQDYIRNGRVVVTETDDALIFENEGSFYDGEPADYLGGEKTPRRYRNPYLTRAMVELGMIDTMGYGIHRMHRSQASRYLPMPDYELLEDAVKMQVYGSVVDPAYTALLMQKTDLTLWEIHGLDKVQKRLPVDDALLKKLRKAKLVEGRKPNLHVSATVAAVSGDKADYIKTRAIDDAFFEKMILDLLDLGPASRKDIDELILDKLSEGLNSDQKYSKISNLLTKMVKNKLIINTGSKKVPSWEQLSKKK